MNTNPVLPPPPGSLSNCLCCNVYHDRDELYRVLMGLELTNVQKQIIMSRYINIIEHLHKRVRTYSRVFYLGHTIITVGSLFVPALLSIQNTNGIGSMSTQIYWATFIISLLVTTFNGVLTLFKIDKKYYFLNTTLERLRTEGWQFFGLTGRYSGHLLEKGVKPTHQNQFVHFTHHVEKIKMKQVEEEYYKSDEKTTQQPQAAATAAHELYPPSPEHPLGAMENAPTAVTDAMKSMMMTRRAMQRDIPASPRPTNTVITPPVKSEVPAVQTSKEDTVITFHSTLNL